MNRLNPLLVLLVFVTLAGCSKSGQVVEHVVATESVPVAITGFATSPAADEEPIHNTARLVSLSVGDQQFNDLVFCSEAHEVSREPGPKGNPKTVTYTGLDYADKESIDVVASVTDDDVSTGYSSQFLHSTLNLLFAHALVDSNGPQPNVFLVEVGGDDKLSVQAIVGGTIDVPELDGSILVVEASDWGKMGRELAGVTNGGFMFTKPVCGVGLDIAAFNLAKDRKLRGIQIVQQNTEEADLLLVAGAR